MKNIKNGFPTSFSLSSLFIVFMFWNTILSAQTLDQPLKDKGVFGVAVSYGNQLDRNASFYGWSVDYNKQIGKGPFAYGIGVMWDNETTLSNENRGIENTATFNCAVTINYQINSKWSIGTGLAKGVMDNDQISRQYQWTDGDWSTGLMVCYQFKLGKQNFNISGSYEYNISQKETSLSFDLGYVIPW